MIWCSGNETPMMLRQLIPTLHEWNMNADDVVMTWFTLYAIPSDIKSGMCNVCTCIVHVL